MAFSGSKEEMMPKSRLVVTAGVLALIAGSAAAQERSLSSDPAVRSGGGARSGHITSTGETVPNPGASQSGGTTSLDKGVQSEDNKIQSSICKGC